jgi:hypothetical protein
MAIAGATALPKNSAGEKATLRSVVGTDCGGDRAKIESGIRELKVGEVHLIDTDGNAVKQAFLPHVSGRRSETSSRYCPYAR